MKREEWREQIMKLPVYDSHTHLNMPNVPIAAQSIWDIVHYFWFMEELWSVGYPRDAATLPEDERIQVFVNAFNSSRNTVWSHIVRRIFQDLYGIDFGNQHMIDENLVRKANQAVKWYSWQPDWAKNVIDKLNIRRIGVNNFEHADFKDLPGVSAVIPVWDGAQAWSERIKQATDKQAAGQAAVEAARDFVEMCQGQGVGGLRVDVEVLQAHWKEAVNFQTNQLTNSSEVWEVDAFMIHTQFAALSDYNMFAQLFLGIKRDVNKLSAMAVNDPQRIIMMYPLFPRYNCSFELVIGCPGNNMDAAQAARIYPNVHLGGLWWYNFRSSTYMQTMQERLEAVPATKSVLIASDARCIEWCYGKILLVKTLLAEFLYQQIALGWLNENEALWTAKEWLHDAAQRRYG